MSTLRRCLGALGLGCVALVPAAPASAQEAPDPAVQISFDLGEHSPTLGDWTVAAVEVRGDLIVGEPVTVVLWGADDRELWAATTPFERPVTRFAVDVPVAVGSVLEAGAWQGLPTAVAGVVIGGALDRAPVPSVEPDPEVVDAPPAPPEVEGAQVVRPHVAWSAAGGGAGKAQLALSMVLAIIVVAVLFRTPLPSTSSERWTR